MKVTKIVKDSQKFYRIWEDGEIEQINKTTYDKEINEGTEELSFSEDEKNKINEDIYIGY